MEKEFLCIGSMRLLNIKIIGDSGILYQGNVDAAPDYIKSLKYYKFKTTDTINLFVHEN